MLLAKSRVTYIPYQAGSLTEEVWRNLSLSF